MYVHVNMDLYISIRSVRKLMRMHFLYTFYSKLCLYRFYFLLLQPIQQPKRPLFSGPSAPVNEYDDEGCIICYEEMGPFDTTRLNCGHFFHTDVSRQIARQYKKCSYS